MDNAKPPTTCPKCGASALADAYFCVDCGSAMRDAQPGTPASSVRKPTQAGVVTGVRSALPVRPLVPPPLSAAKARKAVRTQRIPGQESGLGAADVAPTSIAEAFATAHDIVASPPVAPVAPLVPVLPASPVTQPTAMVPSVFTNSFTSNGAPPADANLPLPPVNLMLDDIDSGFDAIVGGGHGEAAAGSRPEDLVEPQALFAQIAATQTRPIRDFIVELKLGEASREWIRVCMPGVKSLRKSAEEMSLSGLAKALDGFLAALELADAHESAVVGSAARDLITSAYQELSAELPGAFSLEEEGDRREPIIVSSLLAQIPDVRKVALDKIYAAGLTSLSAFYVAKPSDIAEATGIALDLCHHIWERFQRYRKQISAMPPDADRSAEHKRLRELGERLRQLNAAYDGTPGSFGDARDKKQVRQERTDTVLEINMILARLGEVRRVELLERLPFQRKLEELDRYLQAHKSKQRPF